MVWLVLVCLLAFVWNRLPWGILLPTAYPFDPFLISKQAMQILITVTMLMIGSLLPLEEVKQVSQRWPSVLSGTLVQYVSMPFLAWLVAIMFRLEGPYFWGVIMVGCVPGAMASNMLTMISKGNVSYSVGLTTSATLFSPLVVPLVLILLLGKQIHLEGWDISRTLFLTVLSPVVIGFTMSRFFKSWQRLTNCLGEITANIAIIWIIASVVAQNRTLFSNNIPFILCVALLFLNFGGYLAGYWGGQLFRLDDRMRRALVLEVGMQNAGLGTFLATKYFPNAPEATLCCAMYTFGCMFTGVVLAQFFRNLPVKD